MTPIATTRFAGLVGIIAVFWLVLVPLAHAQGVVPETLTGIQRQLLPVSDPGSRDGFDALGLVFDLLNQRVAQSAAVSTREAAPPGAAAETPNPITVGLRALGYDASGGDSIIMLFQRDEGLAVDGVAGPITIGRLIDRLRQLSGGPAIPEPTADDCPSGSFRNGDECATVVVPEHGVLTENGHWWKCEPGYRPYSGECLAVQLPPNARLNRAGTGWECDAGFRYMAGRCARIRVPEHGVLNSSGTDWVCETGFVRRAARCVSVRQSTPGGGR